MMRLRTLYWTLCPLVILVWLSPPALSEELTGPEMTVSRHLELVRQNRFDDAEWQLTTSLRGLIGSREEVRSAYFFSVDELASAEDPSIEEEWRREEGIHRTAMVRVEAGKKKLYFYLLVEEGEWRIDAIRSERFSTLTDARRDLYVNTPWEWDEPGTRFLKSRMQFYELWNRLEKWLEEHGTVPTLEELSATDEKGRPTHPLVSDLGRNQWIKRPIRVEPVSGNGTMGDIGYRPFDPDGNGEYEHYLLVLYGPVDLGWRMVVKGTNIALAATNLETYGEKDSLEVLVREAIKDTAVERLLGEPGSSQDQPEDTAPQGGGEEG